MLSTKLLLFLYCFPNPESPAPSLVSSVSAPLQAALQSSVRVDSLVLLVESGYSQHTRLWGQGAPDSDGVRTRISRSNGRHGRPLIGMCEHVGSAPTMN